MPTTLTARVVAAIAALTATIALARPGAHTQESLAAVLEAAGRYVDALPQTVAGIVLDEQYLQQARAVAVTARQLRSDLSIIADREFGWIEFRDVYEVDGRPVRDRENRIVELFAKPNADALAQARRIVAEGARFNLSPVGYNLTRTLNLPMAALPYLRAGNQGRSTYRHDGVDSIGGRRVIVVQFRETGRPRIIGTPDNSAAEGVFWIEPGSGRVLRSELSLPVRAGGGEVSTSLRTEFAEDARLGVWLPSQMEEEDAIRSFAGVAIATLSGRAIYRDAKRFDVVVEERAVGEAR